MNNTPNKGDSAKGADMGSADILAARAVAILTSRLHNSTLYALRGCEDLDRRYDALRKILRKARLPLPASPDFDAAAHGVSLA